jgi:hypothetical protein
LAVLFDDPSHRSWGVWDYRLIKAHYILQDWYRDGVPIWWDESDRVTFDAEARTSKARAAIERAQEKASKQKSKTPGRYFIAKPRLMEGENFPTMREWLEEQDRKQGGSKFADGDKRRVFQGRK